MFSTSPLAAVGRLRRLQPPRKAFSPLRLFQLSIYVISPFVILKFVGTTNPAFMEKAVLWMAPLQKDSRDERPEEQPRKSKREQINYFDTMQNFKKQQEEDLAALKGDEDKKSSRWFGR
eukprot:NODE_11897_length_531_cov_96.267157_g11609_i0.p1 GENE.NODE_11897_length_531_cov_96.267157_g11609_i0~~NODE_11897_length_531_cov_96.267157_g11609_i0.p1  ORF type:complete len:136 (-),score=41.97 NODE_11897_length_531_cov_96.267157_g11609_i0:124-480(-)